MSEAYLDKAGVGIAELGGADLDKADVGIAD